MFTDASDERNGKKESEQRQTWYGLKHAGRCQRNSADARPPRAYYSEEHCDHNRGTGRDRNQHDMFESQLSNVASQASENDRIQELSLPSATFR